jgi:hypothetical protein
MPQFLTSIPLLPSSYPGKLASRNLTDSNDLLCPFNRPWERTAQKTAPILLRVFVPAEMCLLNSSLATAVRVTPRIVKIPLLLRAGIIYQRLFLWLHISCFKQTRHNIVK